MQPISRVAAVILAAGLGKRMNSHKLKVMHELLGQPLIEYVVSSVESARLDSTPVAVVCNDDLSVQEYLGSRARYAVQAERLGTGHAVLMAEPLLRGQFDHIVALYGDMPFVTANSIKQLIKKHLERGNTITLMTATVPDYLDWRSGLYEYGRIVRGVDGHINRIVEKKDATPAELSVREVNPGYYCFQSEWLWENLKTLRNDNAQHEYYLTALIHRVIEQGGKLSSIAIPPEEAIGINTQEQLVAARRLAGN
ncbi:MAG: Bifunctional protein GlmU [Candidatus Magasanikbacteria bacterium GW2011_GWA2_56_11]|uniref:Bifunctional protein GlmU n=1 Tax=Candidatus Magasanikbacteria bacterium GW2011_GWA2_56_11 TaxID=1619044 RepID=A0A0G1YHC1_9BACT|nr:MAG: Bifunctional protein GlmU [Candidatus Magasanikbacteria bacterium GW2011_GWA2_56_11]